MTVNAPTQQADQLPGRLERQRAAQVRSGYPTAAVRRDRLNRLITLLRENQRAFVAAGEADFGTRPAFETRMELASIVEAAKHAVKHLDRWMRPERGKLPLLLRLTGARAEILTQPLGVVGIVSPWNFPFQLAFAPAVAALAAGNRVMLKPSELSPHSSEAVARAVASAFADEEFTVVLGGTEVAKAFCALPFDHLLYTGSTRVGSDVMRAAAANLTPVTLELGGKCPVVIDPEAPVGPATERLLFGNFQNAGQICLAPDTVYVPRPALEEFVAAARATTARWLPAAEPGADYTGVIDDRNHSRLRRLVDQARAAGARVETLRDASVPAGSRQVVPTLVIDAPGDQEICREEIFGPVLNVRTYSDFGAVVSDINSRPHPLALYYFGTDRAHITRLQEEVPSGGMTVNDVLMHAGFETLPFGGVGGSGMGAYRGKTGFDTLSHRRPVFHQGRFPMARISAPPHTPRQSAYADRALGPMPDGR